MNISGTPEKSTSKRQENGDQTMESERPLKKARYAWQVKGKYHLKNEVSESSSTTTNSTKEEHETSGSSSESDSKDLVENTEQNLEILGDYLLKQDFNTLDSVTTDTNKTITPGTSSNEKLEYPRYVNSSGGKSNDNARKTTSDKAYSALPMSMVLSHGYSEDQCIARWQARQMAKGYVDNTINRVLDSWLAPQTDEDNNQFVSLDIAELINNLPVNNNIENEGIMMAISAHGLQNASSSCTCNIDDSIQLVNNNEACLSPRSSSMPSDENARHAVLNLTDECSGNMASSSFDITWSYSEEFPDPSTQYRYMNEADNLQTNANIEYNNVVSNNSDVDNHYDFLDAAVSFAIQNKGLTSYGADYG